MAEFQNIDKLDLGKLLQAHQDKGVRKQMAQHGKKAKFLKKKFSKLKEEGYPEKQRVAIALSMARKEGYDVGPEPKKKKK